MVGGESTDDLEPSNVKVGAFKARIDAIDIAQFGAWIAERVLSS